MKIVLVSTAVGLGGAERYMFELARWLTDSQHDVSLIVAHEIAAASVAELSDQDIQIQPADIGWDYGPEDNIAGDEYAAKVARQAAGMQQALQGSPVPRVILFNANWPTHYVGAMQATQAAKAPFAVHFHLCPHRVYLNPAAARCHADVLGSARFLSCVSNNNRYFLERTFGARFDFHVILNGSRFEIPEDEKHDLLTASRSNTLLLVGRLDHQKGLIDVLPALAGMRRGNGPRVDVLGDGPLRPLLEAALPAKGSPVRILGNKPDMQARMSRAAGMLLPSHFEGLSLSILEALSVGCIPIVSRASSAGEIIEDGRNGFLFDVADWRSMLRAIDRFNAADQADIRRHCLESSRRFTRRNMLESMRQTLLAA